MSNNPTKRISIIEVAKRAGVGKSTVSRWQNNDPRVSEEARKKIEQAAEELKYRPNTSARSLRNQTNNLLGILISNKHSEAGISSLINSRKITGIINKANELQHDVLILIEDLKDTIRLNEIIRAKGLAGVMLLDIVPDSILESFHDFNVPYVMVNWYSRSFENKQIFVKTDLEMATTLALQLLVDKGYTDIGLINWEDAFIKGNLVENTYTRFMHDRGLDTKNSIFNTAISISNEKVAEIIDSSRKKAYLCFSCHTSVQIYNYCRDNHLRIPDDLALVSYDFFPFYDYMYPRLTGIRQQAELMGELAVEKLIQLIEGNSVECQYVEPELIIRETV